MKKPPPDPDMSGVATSTTNVEPAGATPDTGTSTIVNACAGNDTCAEPISWKLAYVNGPDGSTIVYKYTVTGCGGPLTVSTPKDTDVTSKSEVISKSSSTKRRR